MNDSFPSKTMLATIIGLVVAITGSAALILATHSPNSKPAVAFSAPADQQHNFTYLKYQGHAGKTALELLKNTATVQTTESADGALVASINGVADGADGKYWALYVNGKLAQMAADSYVTQNGDNLEWKLE